MNEELSSEDIQPQALAISEPMEAPRDFYQPHKAKTLWAFLLLPTVFLATSCQRQDNEVFLVPPVTSGNCNDGTWIYVATRASAINACAGHNGVGYFHGLPTAVTGVCGSDSGPGTRWTYAVTRAAAERDCKAYGGLAYFRGRHLARQDKAPTDSRTKATIAAKSVALAD